MARRTQRGSNFPQMGSEGERYQVHDRAGNPKTKPSGNPEMKWRYGTMPTFTEHHEVAAATANILHSIRSASPAEAKHGMEWYDKVNTAVAKGTSKRGFMSGASDKMLSGAGIVAAVSPNMDWDRSNIDAFSELSKLKSSHWDAIASGDRGSLQGMSISSASTPNLLKAHRLIQGADPDTELHEGGSPKTHSFMHNIANPDDPGYVTIDGRAFDTMTNRMRSWDVDRGLTGEKSMSARYSAARDIWKGAASATGLTPARAQAVSWSHTKYDLEQSGRTRKQGPNRVGQPYFDPQGGAPALHLPHISSGQFAS